MEFILWSRITFIAYITFFPLKTAVSDPATAIGLVVKSLSSFNPFSVFFRFYVHESIHSSVDDRAEYRIL